MIIRNMTPHAVTVCGVTYAPDPDGPARVDLSSALVGELDGVPVVTSPMWGGVTGLPAPAPGVALLVSAVVLAQCAGRRDVFAPATAPTDGVLRDAQGRIVGVTRLVAAPDVVSLAPGRVEVLVAFDDYSWQTFMLDADQELIDDAMIGEPQGLAGIERVIAEALHEDRFRKAVGAWLYSLSPDSDK